MDICLKFTTIRRELSSKRLKVATVIHNFALKRNDGSTAASRLFGQQFPDLFEYLIENIGELPQPRRSRKSSKSQTFTLPTVPSLSWLSYFLSFKPKKWYKKSQIIGGCVW